jgi:hypothetical protein
VYLVYNGYVLGLLDVSQSCYRRCPSLSVTLKWTSGKTRLLPVETIRGEGIFLRIYNSVHAHIHAFNTEANANHEQRQGVTVRTFARYKRRPSLQILGEECMWLILLPYQGF